MGEDFLQVPIYIPQVQKTADGIAQIEISAATGPPHRYKTIPLQPGILVMEKHLIYRLFHLLMKEGSQGWDRQYGKWLHNIILWGYDSNLTVKLVNGFLI